MYASQVKELTDKLIEAEEGTRQLDMKLKEVFRDQEQAQEQAQTEKNQLMVHLTNVKNELDMLSLDHQGLIQKVTTLQEQKEAQRLKLMEMEMTAERHGQLEVVNREYEARADALSAEIQRLKRSEHVQVHTHTHTYTHTPS